MDGQALTEQQEQWTANRRFIFLFPSSCAAREISRSPRLVLKPPVMEARGSHFEMMTILTSCMMTAFVLATEIEGQRLLRLLGPFGLFHLFVFSYET